MFVSARFDGEYERQMEFLSETTGRGVSEVLKASVAHYYPMVSASSDSKLPNLSRFIGKQGSGLDLTRFGGQFPTSLPASLPSFNA